MHNSRLADVNSHHLEDVETISTVSSFLDLPPPRYRRRFVQQARLEPSPPPDDFLEELNFRLDELKMQLSVSAADLKFFEKGFETEARGTVRMRSTPLRISSKAPVSLGGNVRKTENAKRTGAKQKSQTSKDKAQKSSDGPTGLRSVTPGHMNKTFTANVPCCGACPPWKPSYLSADANCKLMHFTGKAQNRTNCRKYYAHDHLHRSADENLNATISLSNICTRLLHYHIDINNLPFITSRSYRPGLSRSHSVPANIQQLIGKFKTHSDVLCCGKACGICGGSSKNLERRYAKLYRQYEQVKRDLSMTGNIRELLSLKQEKSILRGQLKNALWIIELSRRQFPATEVTNAQISNGESWRYGTLKIDRNRALLNDLRAAQMLFPEGHPHICISTKGTN